MEKATFRLPEWEMERIRQESTRQGRSINSVVVDLIGRALGDYAEQQELLRALGPMVSRPAQASYEPVEPAGHRPALGDALEWARGDL